MVIHNRQDTQHPPVEEKRPSPAKMVEFFRSKSIDYRAPHDQALSSYKEGTCSWFLGSDRYLRWKSGATRNLACPGIPGAGKTVMSAVVIEDLKLDGKALVLYAYNHYSTQQFQTAHLLFLSFLSQLLEAHPIHSDSTAIGLLYREYSNRPQVPPFYSRVKEILTQEISTFDRSFIVIDALDEFSIAYPHLSVNLVRDLETLGARVLITSRSAIPFTSGCYEECPISASDEDIQSLISSEFQQGYLPELLKRNPNLAKEFTSLYGQIFTRRAIHCQAHSHAYFAAICNIFIHLQPLHFPYRSPIFTFPSAEQFGKLVDLRPRCPICYREPPC
jgi:hypothetical protein